MSALAHVYLGVARRRCSASCLGWWDETVLTLEKPFCQETFDRAFARTARMIGLAEVSLNHHERASLLAHGIPSIDRQPLHELARIALLLHGITQIPHETHADFMWNLFLRGDTAERTALLRGLSVLPNPIRFLDIAVYACSTNIQTIFEAIACENPYPVRFFQELNFNQLVMKALFIDLSVSRIVGLSERISPALRQMVVDHVNERIAAGRLVHQGAIMILNS